MLEIIHRGQLFFAVLVPFQLMAVLLVLFGTRGKFNYNKLTRRFWWVSGGLGCLIAELHAGMLGHTLFVLNFFLKDSFI